MKARIILGSIPLAAALIFSGCSSFQSSADYQQHGYADEVRSSVDRQIRAEWHQEPPEGSVAQTYSSTLWARYWTNRIAEFRTNFPKSKDYHGPTGAQFADYIITTRRSLGLPDLPANM